MPSAAPTSPRPTSGTPGCARAPLASGGSLLAGWTGTERRNLVAGLLTLPEEVRVVPMRSLAWPMAELSADHQGLSTLGAEAVAAAIHLSGRLLVSSRDDGPGIRACCRSVKVRYGALSR